MIEWLLLNRKLVGIVVAVVAVLGLVVFVYEKGVHDERNRVAAQTLQEIEAERKEREAIEERNRGLDDGTATNRLRPHR